LKRIPENARRILLLNQADDPERQAMAGRLARKCLASYDRVMITSLQARPEPLIHARYEPIAGILLAAGGSSRLGQPKQLVRLDGITLIRRTVLTGLEAGLSPLLVVVGSDAEVVIEEIKELPVILVRNQAWQDGQSTSIKAGVGQLPARTGGVVFLLSDQPYLSSEVIRALMDEARATGAPVIAPLIEDQRGNPVYFDRDTLTDLSHLSGEQGGRAIFTRYPPHYLPWGDERLLLDIDTVEDLKRINHG
jgi:molybdenum cofactor cytidylyltransferase